MREPKSIAEQIDCLARLTGAPISFVDQVRDLFVKKGISLEQHADPFLPALEEAFRREERIRCNTRRVRDNLDRMQDSFKRVGRAYVDQLANPGGRKGPRESKSIPVERASNGGTQVTIRGDHRTFVTRPVREELPMVPGPEETQ